MRLSIANYMACGDALNAKRKRRRAAPRQTADGRSGVPPLSFFGARMSLFSPLAAKLDAAPSKADAPLTEASLPPAGFRVCRVCDSRCAIGMFTTHRADPSWT